MPTVLRRRHQEIRINFTGWRNHSEKLSSAGARKNCARVRARYLAQTGSDENANSSVRRIAALFLGRGLQRCEQAARFFRVLILDLHANRAAEE